MSLVTSTFYIYIMTNSSLFQECSEVKRIGGIGDFFEGFLKICVKCRLKKKTKFPKIGGNCRTSLRGRDTPDFFLPSSFLCRWHAFYNDYTQLSSSDKKKRKKKINRNIFPVQCILLLNKIFYDNHQFFWKYQIRNRDNFKIKAVIIIQLKSFLIIQIKIKVKTRGFDASDEAHSKIAKGSNRSIINRWPSHIEW